MAPFYLVSHLRNTHLEDLGVVPDKRNYALLAARLSKSEQPALLFGQLSPHERLRPVFGSSRKSGWCGPA
jgi:hypothetical protein